MTTSCGWVAEYLPTQPSAPNVLAAHCRPAGSLLLRHRGIGVSRGQPSRRASCLPYVPGWRAHVIAIVSPAPLSVRLSCRLLPLRLPSASVVRACPPPHHPYPKRRKHFLILPPRPSPSPLLSANNPSQQALRFLLQRLHGFPMDPYPDPSTPPKVNETSRPRPVSPCSRITCEPRVGQALRQSRSRTSKSKARYLYTVV